MSVHSDAQIDEYKALRKKYDVCIANVLFGMMRQAGISDKRIIDIMKKRYEVALNSGTVSKFKDGTVQIPAIVIQEMCRELDCTIDEFFRHAALEYNEKYGTDKKKNDLLESKAQQVMIRIPSSEFLNHEPDDAVFSGYYGEYYTYFTPTHSNGDGYIKGKMQITKQNTAVHVILHLEVRKTRTSDIPLNKTYEGVMLQSNSVNCCYCILSSADIGELCFLSFRHFKLNEASIECRLAEVLTASAGGEDKMPTVHRMLICSEDIDDAHIT